MFQAANPRRVGSLFREASQSRWKRDPGVDRGRPLAAGSDNRMRGGTGEGRAILAGESTLEGRKAQESYVPGLI
jgi:hypothetical protein